MPARRLREDRLLHEAEATGGDIRRICDLFGLAVGAALRYTSPLTGRASSNTTSATPAAQGPQAAPYGASGSGRSPPRSVAAATA